MEIMESLRHCSLHFRHSFKSLFCFEYDCTSDDNQHLKYFVVEREKKKSKKKKKTHSTHLQMDWQFHKLKFYFLPHVVKHLNLHFKPHNSKVRKKEKIWFQCSVLIAYIYAHACGNYIFFVLDFSLTCFVYTKQAKETYKFVVLTVLLFLCMKQTIGL